MDAYSIFIKSGYWAEGVIAKKGMSQNRKGNWDQGGGARPLALLDAIL